MHLVAEVLDKQILDATGRNAGKADGIVARLRGNQPPLIEAVEVSPITLLRRFSSRAARRYAAIDAHFGPERGKPYRIPWSSVETGRGSLRTQVRADETPIMAAERWLRKRIRHIPGA